MPVGTIKSGKSTLLNKVIPGMLAVAYASGSWPSDRGRPVIFEHAFAERENALEAVAALHGRLAAFGRAIGVPYLPPEKPNTALTLLTDCLLAFAKRVARAGGELWLLLDELQFPWLASTPAAAAAFTRTFKEVSPIACVCLASLDCTLLIACFVCEEPQRVARVLSAMP